MLILLIGGADYRLLTHNPKIPVLRKERHKAKYRSSDEIWPFPTFQEREEESASCVSQHVNGGEIRGVGKVKVV